MSGAQPYFALQLYFQFKMPWPTPTESKAVEQLDNQLDEKIATLIEQAKETGGINPNLPTLWIISFYDATLMAAWSLISS